jgi:glycosyltransferase involved in cell wall biosynthesis
LILVNDGSRDESWEILYRYALENPCITAIDLARNYGQQAAIFCGLEISRGDYVLTLDDDLQNPPEEMGRLIEKALEGYDLVFGRFREKRHSWFRRFGSFVIRNLNKRMYGKPRQLAVSNFRIFRRDLVDQMISHAVKRPYIQGLALKFSKRCTDVWVHHQEREGGSSQYRFYQFVRTLTELISTFVSFRFYTAKKTVPYTMKRMVRGSHDASRAHAVHNSV